MAAAYRDPVGRAAARRGGGAYIAARAPCRDWLLGAALAKLNGTVRSGGATFDWFQPVALYDFEILDSDGQQLVIIPAVRGNVPLWRLLTDPSNLGVFRIERPRLEIVVREGGSNLKDLLARLEEDQDDRPDDDAARLAGGATVGVDLISGTVVVRRKDSPRSWDAREIQLSARVERAADGETQELVVAPGRVLDHITITPDVCDDFLKFFAPTMAKVTRAGGTFSLDVDRYRVPLDDPNRGDVAGKLTLHEIKAGPGPMVDEIAAMFGVADANQLANEQEIRFELREGRMYHEGMALTVGPMGIATKGSVGLEDQSLAIALSVRLPEFDNQTAPLRGMLSGETLTLPIAGTLADPQIDPSVVRDSGLGVLSNLLESLISGKPITAEAIQQGLREGQLLGEATGPALNSPNGEPGTDGASAGLAFPLLDEILRQRAASIEQRRAQAADADASQSAQPPPGKRPLRRRARQLLDSLGRPPAPAETPPSSAPPDI